MISLPLNSARLEGKPTFMDGARCCVCLPAFRHWMSCVAFVYFARDAGADWVRTIVAATTNGPGSKLLLLRVDENSYAPVLVAITAALSSLCLLPTATLIAQHVKNGLWGQQLPAQTMPFKVWVPALGVEAPPAEIRRSFLAGVCLTLFVGNLLCAVAALFAPVALSPSAMMCMAMMTPLFYILSLLGAARSASAVAMLAMAFLSEPLIARLAPQASVLIAGLTSCGILWTCRKFSGAP